MGGPKSSGSSTSSEAAGDSGSGLKEPVILNFQGAGNGGKKASERGRILDRVPSLKSSGGGSAKNYVVSALIHSRGIEFKDDGTLHSLKGASIGGSSKNFVASATVKSTRTRSRSTTATSRKHGSQATLEDLEQSLCRTLTSYARDFLASHSASLESGRASATLAAHSSLRLLGLLRSNDLGFCSLRTSRDSSATMTGEPSGPSSPRWMNWGTMRNGRCLTASISESRRIGSASSLSDILEENPGPKYFLSERAVGSLLAHRERQRKAGHGFGASIATIGKEEPDR